MPSYWLGADVAGTHGGNAFGCWLPYGSTYMRQVILCATVLLTAWSEAGAAASWFEKWQVQDLSRCGANALHFCATYLGTSCSRAHIDDLLPPTGDVTDLKSIRDAAKALGLATYGAQWSAVPDVVPSPMIVRTVQRDGRSHFLVLVARRADELLVVDVPRDPYWVDVPTFQSNFGWNGYALHLARHRLDFVSIWLRVYLREGIALVVVLVVATILVARRRRWRRKGPPTVNDKTPEAAVRRTPAG